MSVILKYFLLGGLLYLMVLTGIWYKMTDHSTPILWLCEKFESTWDDL